MRARSRLIRRAAFVAISCFAPISALSQTSGHVEVDAKPVTGQLDVLQGTAIQLGGKVPESGPRPSGYRWEIIEGEGAMILKPDQLDAIFQGPKLKDANLELFLLQLTVSYEGQESATARLQVRVHREMPTTKRREPTIEEVMTEQYRMESEARERRRSSGAGRTTVIHHGPSYGWGYGWGPGWGWGWPSPYPIHVPIVVPPPGGDLGPGDIDWDEPVAVPYDDLVTKFPGEIADDYLPQDNPMAEPIPDSGLAGDNPADFMLPPDMGSASPEPMIMDDPGFGGADFAEPMIDPGFGFDDFGW